MEKLKLIIGEGIPEDIQYEFSEIEFYIKDGDNLTLYAEVVLPYIINHAEAMLDIEGDPRYTIYEAYEKENKGCRYLCLVKPLGELMGVYRLGLGSPFKIREIKPLEGVKIRALK